MTCRRCGDSTPRLTIGQRYCPTCAREVARLIDLDQRRRSVVRFPARDETWRVAA